MKETIIDAIINFFGKKNADIPLSLALLKVLSKLELENNGCESKQEESDIINIQAQSETSSRIYSHEEATKLGTKGQSLLQFLENNELINSQEREQIIQETMISEGYSIEYRELKSIIIDVLKKDPSNTPNIDWLNYIFFYDNSKVAH